MAHMIDMSNGRANMAYTGAVPWHGLGATMEDGATLEQWRAAAGMDYKVLAAPVQFTNGALHTFKGKQVLYRSDTNAPLGVVSDGYKVVQPAETLEFFREYCDAGHMQMETAGVLRDGAIYWALAKTSHSFQIDRDITQGYVLLSTSADGSRATDARLTSIRVVCNNTLSVAMATGAKSAVRTRHNTRFNADATKAALGLKDSFADSWAEFSANMHKLADTPVTQNEASEFFSELLRPAGERAKPRANAGASTLNDLLSLDFTARAGKVATDKAPVQRAIRGYEDLMQSYLRAPGAVPGTAYGLVQGVTHFIDHVRGASDDSRLTSAWFGQGATLKQTAYEKALALGR